MPDAITAPGSDYFSQQAAQRAASEAAKAAASPSSTTDADMFLKLLVAQMRYQNPMEPMKGNEFIAQSAQLATVQALQAMQKSQASADTWAQVGAAHQMLGTQVVATTDDGTPVTGIATAVTTSSDGPRLTLTTPTGQVQVALSSVRSTSLGVISGSNPGSAPTAPAPTTSTTTPSPSTGTTTDAPSAGTTAPVTPPDDPATA